MNEVLRVARSGARVDVTVAHTAKRNAMSVVLQDALATTFAELARDTTIGLVVVTGDGPAFCAGGDLVEVAAADTSNKARALAVRIRAVMDLIRRFPAPVVAALNGPAIGGGSEFALAADYRVAAADARIVFGQVGQAVTPGWGGGVDLIERVGAATAQRLLASGTELGHAEGLALGLYDAVAGAGARPAPGGAPVGAPRRAGPGPGRRGNKAVTLAARFTPERARVEGAELEQFVATWMHADHWTRLNAFLARPRG